MTTMTNFRNICAAAVFLIGTAAPAMAYDGQRAWHDPYAPAFRAHHPIPGQDAINFGYGNIYPKYHSGWGGLYGDGNYPGTIDDNTGPPYWSRR